MNKILNPEEISLFWEIIKAGLEDNLPYMEVEKDIYTSRMFKSLLGGTLFCAIHVVSEGVVDLMAIITPTFDAISGVKNLLVYTIATYGEVSRESCLKGLAGLEEFAKKAGCNRICYYTENEELVHAVKDIGREVVYMITSAIKNNRTL
jgi:hypothetical protein